MRHYQCSLMTAKSRCHGDSPALTSPLAERKMSASGMPENGSRITHQTRPFP